MKSTIKFTLIAFVIAAFSFQTEAQNCSRTLKSKTGKVYSANPGTYSVTATSDQVTVKIKKTAGRAETQVNILVNGQMQSNPIEYNNGNYIPSGWQTRTLNGVSGKVIKVQVVNQSVANTISYSSKIIGNSNNVTTTGKKVTGLLLPQTNKTIYTNASCTGKARIIVRRTNGVARGNIRVWERIGINWVLKNNAGAMIEQNQDKKIWVVNSNKALKIELRNVSVGNRINYVMNALVAN